MVKEIRRTSRNTLIIFGFFFLLSVLWIGSESRSERRISHGAQGTT